MEFRGMTDKEFKRVSNTGYVATYPSITIYKDAYYCYDTLFPSEYWTESIRVDQKQSKEMTDTFRSMFNYDETSYIVIHNLLEKFSRDHSGNTISAIFPLSCYKYEIKPWSEHQNVIHIYSKQSGTEIAEFTLGLHKYEVIDNEAEANLR